MQMIYTALNISNFHWRNFHTIQRNLQDRKTPNQARNEEQQSLKGITKMKKAAQTTTKPKSPKLSLLLEF